MRLWPSAVILCAAASLAVGFEDELEVPVTFCHNGGILNLDGRCTCSEYYTGVVCETPVCQHGTANEHGACVCDEYYSGLACQFPPCTKPLEHNFVPDTVPLIIVVEQSYNVRGYLLNLAQNFNAVYKATRVNGKDWIGDIIIHAFDDNGSIGNTAKFSQVSDAATNLTAIAQTSMKQVGCHLPIYEALKDVHVWSVANGYNTQNAYTVVITSATPNNEDSLEELQKLYGTADPIVDYMRVTTAKCNTENTKDEISAFTSFAQSTDGVLYRVSEDKAVDGTAKFWNSRYAPQTLMNPIPTDCTKTNKFQVNIDLSDVFVVVSGQESTVKITAPDGNDVKPKKIFDGDTVLFMFTPTMEGEYNMTQDSTNAVCAVSVYSRASIRVVVNFVQNDASSDDTTDFAVKGAYNFPVYQVVGSDGRIAGTLNSITVSRRGLTTGTEILYSSTLSARQNCGFGLISEAIKCSSTEDEKLTFTISGVDDVAQPLVRKHTTWCKAIEGQSTASPTPITVKPTAAPTHPTVQSTLAPTSSVYSTGTTTCVCTSAAPVTSPWTTPIPTTPSTVAPTTHIPSTQPPTTPAPTTHPSTAAPTTIQTTHIPSTAAPTTHPSTPAPTTLPPTTKPTIPPSTAAPTSTPTTPVPTTPVTSTAASTTHIPSTLPPSTAAPTTMQTTHIPSTAAPTTHIPSTLPPSTAGAGPTTIPTTHIPSTAAPTTIPTTPPSTARHTTTTPTSTAPPTTTAYRPTCVNQSSIVLGNDHRTLVLFLESSTHTQSSLYHLSENLRTLYESAQAAHPQWIEGILIHSFIYNGAMKSIAYFTDVDQAAVRVRQIADNATDVGVCDLPIFKAMATAFNMYPAYYHGAEVLLVTAAAANDADQDGTYAALKYFGVDPPMIDYIHLETEFCNINWWNENLSQMANFVRATGGVLFRTTPDDVAEATTKFVPTRYAATRLTDPVFDSCARKFDIQVDYEMNNLYVVVAGDEATVTVVDSNTQLQTTDMMYHSTVQRLWHFSPNAPGVFHVTINSNSSYCFPAVYGSGGVRISYGFVQDDPFRDDPTPVAYHNSANFPVYSIYGTNAGYVDHSTIVRTKLDGSTISTYDSVVYARTHCTFSFISEPFLCGYDDEHLSVTVTGFDGHGNHFKRFAFTWCKAHPAPPPTTTPIPTTPKTTVVSVPPTTTSLITSTEYRTSPSRLPTRTTPKYELTTRSASTSSILTAVFTVVFIFWSG